MGMCLPRVISYVFAVIFCLIILWVTCATPVIQKSDPGCRLSRSKATYEYEYYQEGDIIIGGLFTVNTDMFVLDIIDLPIIQIKICSYIDYSEYRNLLAFILAVDEINKNPDVLPNITLGFQIHDSCGDAKAAISSVLKILSGTMIETPNYSCKERDKLAGFIGDRGSQTILPMAHIINLYGYTQIASGSTNSLLNDRALFPHLFWMVPENKAHYGAVLKLLKHFNWNWVGIITSNDESGEKDLQELSRVITCHGICIEYIVKISNTLERHEKDLAVITRATSQVLILTGSFSVNCLRFLKPSIKTFENITIILSAAWTGILSLNSYFAAPLNGSLSFVSRSYRIPGIKDFFNNINVTNRLNDPLLEDIWLFKYHCFIKRRHRFHYILLLYDIIPRVCTGNETMKDIVILQGYESIRYYYEVHAMAHALHDMHLHMKMSKSDPKNSKYESKLHNYVRRVSFTVPSGKNISFNEKGEVPEILYLRSMKITKAKAKYQTEFCYVGIMRPDGPEDPRLYISEKYILWKTGKVPLSRCNDYCPPGHRKAPNEGYHACCYDCVECSEGEVSNVTDSDSCRMCPETEWPDKRRVMCIPKMYNFLSYEKDTLTLVFSVISIIFSFITILILAIFILFRSTPIVRANNRNLSFLLLVSIMLSFLCVFLFLGRPVDITCKLRQAIFGIIFSVALSSVLAKTITVCIAFKATKPGSFWRKWVGAKISHYIVTIVSSIQFLINVIWLSIAPPFQENNMHTYPGVIIVQCNEGSVIAFYSVLGYMGVLAAVSFLLAFMVRTLPDSFNEAKYITFSMLVFCSVWIATIPAYLSTKGKDTVSVEIFAILASSAGLLSCIFFSKCYMLLRKSKVNSKKNILEKS